MKWAYEFKVRVENRDCQIIGRVKRGMFTTESGEDTMLLKWVLEETLRSDLLMHSLDPQLASLCALSMLKELFSKSHVCFMSHPQWRVM